MLFACWMRVLLIFFCLFMLGKFTCRSWATFSSSMLSLGDAVIESRSKPSVVQLTLQQSMTDIFGAVVTIQLGQTGDILCPVSALLAYFSTYPPTPGQLFLLSSGDPLSRDFLITVCIMPSCLPAWTSCFSSSSSSWPCRFYHQILG